MKKLVTSIALMASLAGFSGLASAAEQPHGLAEATEHAAKAGHYPILKPKNVDWSFAGPFGKYDKAQLQARPEDLHGSLFRLPLHEPRFLPHVGRAGVFGSTGEGLRCTLRSAGRAE